MSDDPIEPLPAEYEQAKLEILEHNYRKIFGLSYIEFLEEPIDKILIAQKIETMQNNLLQMKNSNHGN